MPALSAVAHLVLVRYTGAYWWFTMSGGNGGNPLENELNTYRTIQKEIGKVQGQISTAGTQILENEMVLKVRG